jgi:thioredoxin-related protein
MSTIFKITAVFLLLTSIPLTTSAQAAKVNWMSLEEAVAAQQDEPRKIIMDVYTQWCGPCKMMMSRTFTNQQVIDYINGNYYAVKFDAESANPVKFKGKTFSNPGWKQNVRGRNSTHELSRALGVNAYPTLVYMDENADIIAPISGYKTPPQLEMYLKFFVDQYNGDIAQEEWEAYRDNFQPSFQ